MPPHQTICRRHRLWTGPAARTHAAQLDIGQLPEILQAQRRHLALLHHHPRQDVETTISAATQAIYQALRGGTWIPGVLSAKWLRFSGRPAPATIQGPAT